MNFAYSEEQEAFRAGVRRFATERAPLAALRRRREAGRGDDPALWRALCDELALPGLALPEAYGGQGFGLLELGIALEELAAQLAGGPLLSSAVLAGRSLLAAGDEAARRAWLPRIAAGGCVAALALSEGADPLDLAGIACAAAPEGAGAARLDGAKRWVLGGAEADLLLVVAREPGSAGEDGLSLFAVERDAAGLAVEPVESLDLTRGFAHLRLAGVAARRASAPGGAASGLRRALDECAVALAAEQVGGAAACLERALSHVRQRIQFGRPIGSFQAVKHRAADAALQLELARAAASHAAWTADHQPERLAEAASLSRALACEAFAVAAAENIHLHGGMGFTWEHDAHLFYRRARTDEVLLGDARWHRARLVRELGWLA